MTSSLAMATVRQRLAQWTQAGWFGWALALCSTFASSIVTPLSRGLIVAGVDPISLLLVRLSLAVTLIALTLAITQPALFRIDRRGCWRVLGVGAVAGVEICCFFSALAYVDASMSAMIKSTQPLVVLLLLTLGGERLTRRHLVRLGLAFCGIYLLVGGPSGGAVAPIGLLLLLASLLLYGSQLVFTQWWLGGYNTHTVTFYLTSVMTVIIAGWWWVQGVAWRDPGASGWMIIGVLAVVSTWFARLALYGAIPRIGTGQIALLWPLQTLTIIVLSVIFLNERMTSVQWMGGAFVLSSAMLAIERVRQVSRQ
ncbi:MAG: DMT family transporter [Caldilineaceae bacterium]